MGGGGGGKGAPAQQQRQTYEPPAPTPTPEAQQQPTSRYVRDAARAGRRRGGVNSSVLTDPLGVSGDNSGNTILG